MGEAQEDVQSDTQPSLSLPASHFAKLAPPSFLSAHLPRQRPSGRNPAQARAPTINLSSLTHAHGSAVVRVGDTSIVCGVRGEIVEAAGIFHRSEQLRETYEANQSPAEGDSDAERIAELGLLVPNVELATGCSPLYLPGNPPTALAQSLTHRLLTALRIADLVRFADLMIWAPQLEGGGYEDATAARAHDDAMNEDDVENDVDDDLRKPRLMAFWTLYIDILVISLDGSPFDAAWASILGALHNTRLPRAWWERDSEMVLCDPRPDQLQRLALNSFPIALSFAVFNPPVRVGSRKTEDGVVHVLVDPDDFEESCCSQTVTVTVDQNGAKILRIEMEGGVLLDSGDMKKLVGKAGQRWEEWKFVMDSVS